MEQKEINRRHLVHAGIIANNFVIAGLVLLFLATVLDLIQALFSLAVFFVILLLILVLLLSLFTLYGWFKDLNVSSWFDPSGAFFASVKEIVHTAVPYVFGITVALAIASVALLMQDRDDRHAGRIVAAALAVIFGITAMCVNFI